MQLVELQEARKRFASRGLGLAAVTYDSAEILRKFGAAQGIEYPLLADPESRLIRAFGVLDPDNSDFNRAGDGSAHRDMAYPGYFVIDPAGTVVETFFEAIYSDRHTPDNVLGRLFPALMEPGRRVEAPHLTVRLGQSDLVAAPGNRITLFVDLAIPRGVHLYAASDRPSPYRALDLELTPTAPFETRPAVYPPASTIDLPAIGERLAVYEGRLRVSRDLIAPGRSMEFLMALKASPDHATTVEIPGTLRYQACDRKACFPPEAIPLSWRLTVRMRTMKK